MENKKFEYSFWGYLQLAMFFIRTKLMVPKARILRYPITIRGKKYIDFGVNLTTGVGCRFECFPGSMPHRVAIKFGQDVQVNDNVHIVGMNSVIIGDNVLMASNVFISDNSHGSYKGDEFDSDPTIPPTQREYRIAPISIGKNTWIGESSMIMPGVTIGEGCVIGAHSIVNKDIPDYCIAVGSPAKVIKKYDFNQHKWVKANV